MKPRKSSATRRPNSRPASADAARPVLPVWKKALFALVAGGLVLALLEGLLALGGVRPALYERDPYVGFAAHVPLFERDPDARDPDLLVTARNKQRFFNVQRFAARKPAGTYRIFCLGGSTTYGHPYADSTSFCGWLRSLLPVADPSRRWELINAGGVSYASYREALLMEELARYKPDLFIILTGHNEFLEERTYRDIIAMPRVVRGLGALVRRTRLGAAGQMLVTRFAGASADTGSAPTTLPAEVETRLERVVGPAAYHRDDTLRAKVIDHYRFNLARMADIARAAGARVVFVTPASNLRNCAPFKSEHRAGLTEAELRAWQDLAARAAEAEQARHWADALAALDEAARIDDRHAALHYARGDLLWKLGRFAEAKAAFLRAREEDVCPLRALASMLEAVTQVAAARGATVVDFVKLLEARSAHATPGDDWFLDHVHPTIEGHRQLALALIETLRAQGTVRLSAGWTETAIEAVRREVEGRITPETHGQALCTLAKVIAWAGKHQEALTLALRATQLAPDDPAVQFEAGKNAAHLGRHAQAIPYFERALALQPGFVEAHASLARALAAQGRFADAVRHCEAALAVRPDDAEVRCNFGGLLQQQGRLPEAVEQFRLALRTDPNYAEAHNNLAWVLKDQGRLEEALTHFREAERLKPGLPATGIGLVWILAAHPEARVRNSDEAIRLGERLVERSDRRNWMSLDALAAAYAGAGRFNDAVATARRALELAQVANASEARGVTERLALYERGQPYREAVAGPSGAPGP